MPTFQEVESDRTKLLAVFNKLGICDLSIGAHRIEEEPQSPEHLWELWLETAREKGFEPEAADYFKMVKEQQSSSPENALVLIPSRLLTNEELAVVREPISDLWGDESFSCGIRLQSPNHVEIFGGGYDVAPE